MKSIVPILAICLMAAGCGRDLRVASATRADYQAVDGVALFAVLAEAGDAGRVRARFPQAVEAAGLRLREAGDSVALGSADLGVRLVLTRLALESEPLRLVRERVVRDGGPMRIDREPSLARQATAVFQATLIGPDGGARMRDRAIIGRAVADPDPTVRRDNGVWLHDGLPVSVVNGGGDSALLNAALDDALDRLLRPLAAGLGAGRSLPLDTSDPSLEAILETAAAGDHSSALRDLRRLAGEQSGNAVVAYNLAVLLDISGQLEEALEWYGRALGLDPKPLYERRLADARVRAR